MNNVHTMTNAGFAGYLPPGLQMGEVWTAIKRKKDLKSTFWFD